MEIKDYEKVVAFRKEFLDQECEIQIGHVPDYDEEEESELIKNLN